jgi:drug/metabolite transporter (DMT)-like permease
VAVQLLVVAVLSGLGRLMTPTHLTLTPGYLGAVALTGLVASTLGIAVQVWAQARTAAVRAGVIYSLEPVFAVAWGLALGGPWPVAAELLGGALLLAAVLVSELGAAFVARREAAAAA